MRCKIDYSALPMSLKPNTTTMSQDPTLQTLEWSHKPPRHNRTDMGDGPTSVAMWSNHRLLLSFVVTVRRTRQPAGLT